jgi:predicted ATP-grasp superfamily ATP-dependent carboligase
MSHDRPRIMVLDGDYTHTLAVHSELKQLLNAEIISVASTHRSPGHLSRRTDVRVVAPPSTSAVFGDALVELASTHRPDLIVPVGFASTSAVLARRPELNRLSRTLTPDEPSFSLAASKTRTYRAAAEAGVRVPKEYGTDAAEVRARLAPDLYPIFAKARLERGGVSTAFIRSPEDLRRFDPAALGGDVIFQEYVDGDTFTYAHGGFFERGEPVVSLDHVERRSVPRRGGSGTRVVSARIPELASEAQKLLRHLSWTGMAQVEFKLSSAGEYILMEINPKLWASYALASRSGHPIVATAAARRLDTDPPQQRGRIGVAMVFPFREMRYVAENLRDENVLASAAAMLWPPAKLDFEAADLRAHLPRRFRQDAP